jgi:hypothetical protein
MGERRRRLPGGQAAGEGKKLTAYLKWSLTWGKEIEVLRQFEKETGMVPRALQDMPKLDPGNVDYLEAYFCLSASRQYNESGRQPLQIDQILAYLTGFLGISGVDKRMEYLTLIQALDQVALAHYADQAEKATRK